MERYAGSRSWIRYRQLLAERAGVPLEEEPEEREATVRGHRLHLDHWRPAAAPRGTVILVHGGGGNGRVLAPFARLVTEAGWAALAPDLPGYGLTEPAPDYRGDYGEWPAVLAALAASTPGPVALAGFSLGGLTAVLTAQQAPSVQGVIATTLLDPTDPDAFARAARWPKLAPVLLPALRNLPARLEAWRVPLTLVAPLRAMTADRELQRWFLDDPLLGRLPVPLRFLRTLHQTGLTHETLPCPLLLVHPGADAWTPIELSRRTFERLCGAKRLRVLTNGSHLPVERPAYDELGTEFSGFLAALGPRIG